MSDCPIPAGAYRVAQKTETLDERNDYAFSPDGGMLRLSRHITAGGEYWWAGDFVDYRGIVSVTRERRFTRLDTVAGNRCHVRTWQKNYGDRTVAQLCRAFLTDLHGAPKGGQHHGE